VRVDGRRFDQAIVTVTVGSRRGLLLLLALLAGLFWRPADDTEAGKRDGRHGGKWHGPNRPRRRHARRRQHKKKKKQEPPPPPRCSPENPDGPCEGNQLCVEGVCQPCTITCDGEPAACGAALQAVIIAAPAEPIYVCPGRYGGGFGIGPGVAIVGAGDGDDPSVDTILEAISVGRVLSIGPGPGDVRLERLRITGGNEGTSGGGISSNGGRGLTLRRCTVSGNHAADDGGGIYNQSGTLTLDNCRIEENSADRNGGGIFFASSASCTLTGNTQVRGNEAGVRGGGLFVHIGTVTVDDGCRVTANEAPAGQGGGIYKNAASSAVTLANDQIVTDNIGGNCAGASITNCNG
jgi:parallel beta-helix repeat protein